MPEVTWDSAFEASPADTDEAKYGASKIRQLKLAISERGELEFNWKAGTQPFVKAGKASVCFKGTTDEINGLTGMAEGALAYDSTTNTLKRYSGSAWEGIAAGGASGPFPSGTKMLFYQNTAPTGWTIQTTLDDKLVYVTKGSAAGGYAGGTSMGSWTISGLSSAGSHSHTLGSHKHELPIGEKIDLVDNVNWPHGTSGTSRAVRHASGATGETHDTKLSGPPAGDTNTGEAGSHTHTGNGSWRPAAYCCIICQKN